MSKEDNIIPVPPSSPPPPTEPAPNAHERNEAEGTPEVTIVPDTLTPKEYGKQLATLILCGTSSWAVCRTSYDVDRIAWGTFTYMLAHGLICILKVTIMDENKEKIGSFYNYFDYLSKFVPLPLINTQIYLNCNYHGMIVYSHAVSCLLPIAFNGFTKDWNVIDQTESKTAIVKLVSFTNICSLGYIGVTNENYWAIGLSVLSLINEVALDFLEDNNNTIALAFFNIFAVNALESI